MFAGGFKLITFAAAEVLETCKGVTNAGDVAHGAEQIGREGDISGVRQDRNHSRTALCIAHLRKRLEFGSNLVALLASALATGGNFEPRELFAVTKEHEVEVIFIER